MCMAKWEKGLKEGFDLKKNEVTTVDSEEPAPAIIMIDSGKHLNAHKVSEVKNKCVCSFCCG